MKTTTDTAATRTKRKTRRPTKREEEERARRQALRLLFRERFGECSLRETDRRAASLAKVFGQQWAPQLAKAKDPFQLLWMLTNRLVACGTIHAVTGRLLVDLLNAAGSVYRDAKSGDPAKIVEGLGLLVLAATEGFNEAIASIEDTEELMLPLTWGDLEREDLAAEAMETNGRQTLGEGASGNGD